MTAQTELTDLIREWQRELATELPVKIHAGAPATGKHTRGGAAEPSPDDEGDFLPVSTVIYYNPGMTGLPFTRQFERFITGEHGGDFPASDAFAAVRDWCRAEHWAEQWEGHAADNPFAWNLCARLVIAAVELRQPVSFIAAQEGRDLWLTRNLLSTALAYAQGWRADRRKGVRMMDESRKQLDEAEALPVVLAREHRLDDEQQLWEGIRLRYDYLPSWEDELTRRRAFHAKRCVEGCILLVRDEAA